MEKEKKFEGVKVKFNHNAKTLPEALGISVKRFEELFTYHRDMIMKKNLTEQIEEAINNEELTQFEKYIVLFIIGTWFEHERSDPIGNIVGVIRMIRKRSEGD